MSFSRHKKLFILGALLAITIAIPLTIYLTGQKQQSKSNAQPSTTLSFSPTSSSTSPLVHEVADTIPLTISLNPGINLVSTVSLEISYDPTVLEPTGTAAFTPNVSVLPQILDGPVYSPGKIQVILSIGNDPTRAIQTTSTIGTVTFTALKNSPSVPVTFSQNTKAFSLSSGDSNNENVLAGTNPAFIQVGTSPTPTLFVTPTPSNSPTPFPTPTPHVVIPTITSIPTIKPVEAGIMVYLDLHGIGRAGDNTNPINDTSSNKLPQRPTRPTEFFIYDLSESQLITSVQTSITYSPQTANGGGYFFGITDLGDIPNGNYIVYVKTPGLLRKRIPGVFQSLKGQYSGTRATSLVTGDIDDDNALTILDYSTLLDCGYGDLNALPMSDPNSPFNNTTCQNHAGSANADLNDDGIINRIDYNLLIREIGVQPGQ